jgi:hypothetical protein
MDIRKELEKVWKRRNGEIDTKQVDYCLKASKYIEIDGWIVDVCDAKPKIESTLWYDDEGHLEKNKDNFVYYNAMNLPGKIDIDGYDIYLVKKYSRQPDDCKLAGVLHVRRLYDREPGSYIKKLSQSDIEILNNAILEVAADYMKRLDRYWNRYADKVHCSGYWANR